MLVLTPKYGSLIDIDLLKKQKDSLINHRNDIIYLTYYKNITEAYLAFLDNKDKYVIGYKPKDADEINEFVKSLGEIDILDVSWIDVSEIKDLSNCFEGCKVKHIIGLDKWDVSNVYNMSYMFRRCGNLESIGDISGWDVSNVKDMYYMFSYCEKLENIGDLSRWVVSKSENMYYMFNRCKSLKTIDISGWDVSNVKDMYYMFNSCENLESIGDISSWDVSRVISMACMFYKCEKLASVGDLDQWKIKKSALKYDMFKHSAIKPIPSWYIRNIVLICV